MFLNPGSKPDVYKRNIDVPGVALSGRIHRGLPAARRGSSGGLDLQLRPVEHGGHGPGYRPGRSATSRRASSTSPRSRRTRRIPPGRPGRRRMRRSPATARPAATWELRDPANARAPGPRARLSRHPEWQAELDEFDVLATAVVKALDGKYTKVPRASRMRGYGNNKAVRWLVPTSLRPPRPGKNFSKATPALWRDVRPPQSGRRPAKFAGECA